MNRLHWVLALSVSLSACGGEENCLEEGNGCEAGAYCDLGTQVCETTVQFADSALAACASSAVGQSPVSAAKAAEVTQLSCPGYGIVGLGGIEAFTGLRELSLWENDIVELGPLAQLGELESLQLGNNHIGNLAPLAGLTQLHRLGVADNLLFSVAPIVGLGRLEWLNIDDNQITDGSLLLRLSNLRWLSAEDNTFDDDSVFDMLDDVGCEVYKRRATRGPAVELASPVFHDLSAAPEMRVDARGEVFFVFDVDGTEVVGLREYAGRLVHEDGRLVYHGPRRSAVVGELGGEPCTGHYAAVCDFSVARKAPNGAWAGRPAFSVSLSLRAAPTFAVSAPSGGRVTIEPFALASPNQLDAGSCVFMANTGAMEILMHQRTAFDQITYDSDTDFSERWLMNASDYVPSTVSPYAITDLVYAFNYFGGGLLSRDYPFTLGYVRETSSGYARSNANDPDAYLSAQYNWFDDLPSNWEADIANTLEGDRTLVFVDPDLNSSSIWAVGLMNDDVIERIKWELRSKMAPVIVVYNHFLYWHATIVVGYDDFDSEGTCPMVMESISYFERQGASSYASAIRNHMDREGGCRDHGVFYVRDSIYDGDDEPMFDYGGVYDMRYSNKIEKHSYDWAKYLGNHAYTVQRR